MGAARPAVAGAKDIHPGSYCRHPSSHLPQWSHHIILDNPGAMSDCIQRIGDHVVNSADLAMGFSGCIPNQGIDMVHLVTQAFACSMYIDNRGPESRCYVVHALHYLGDPAEDGTHLLAQLFNLFQGFSLGCFGCDKKRKQDNYLQYYRKCNNSRKNKKNYGSSWHCRSPLGEICLRRTCPAATIAFARPIETVDRNEPQLAFPPLLSIMVCLSVFTGHTWWSEMH